MTVEYLGPGKNSENSRDREMLAALSSELPPGYGKAVLELSTGPVLAVYNEDPPPLDSGGEVKHNARIGQFQIEGKKIFYQECHTDDALRFVLCAQGIEVRAPKENIGCEF